MDSNTLQKINDPLFIDQMLEHIISGGSLPNLCTILEIKYPRVVEWIYADPTLAQKYEGALKARGEWFIQSILNELKDIGLADIRQAYDQNNNLLPPNLIPPALSRVIQAIEVEEIYEGQGDKRTVVGYTKRLKLWDKLRALELLGKNLKLFKEQVEVSGVMTLEELVMGSMAVVEVETKAITENPEQHPTPANTSPSKITPPLPQP